MHCISLTILSRLSRFFYPAVGTNWPFCVGVPLNNQPTNSCINDTTHVWYYVIAEWIELLLIPPILKVNNLFCTKEMEWRYCSRMVVDFNCHHVGRYLYINRYHHCLVSIISWYTISSDVATFQTVVVALVLSRLDYSNGVLIGLPTYLLRRLQYLMRLHRWSFHITYDHITDVLASLHWLRVPDRIQFKIAVLTYKVLHGTAPCYLGPLVRVSDLLGQRCLHAASTDCLVLPSFKLSTIGSGTFNVAAARTWNGLPEDVTLSPTLPAFRKSLKTHLFSESYPDIVP